MDHQWLVVDNGPVNHQLCGVILEVIVSASDNLTEAEEAAEQLGVFSLATGRSPNGLVNLTGTWVQQVGSGRTF